MNTNNSGKSILSILFRFGMSLTDANNEHWLMGSDKY